MNPNAGLDAVKSFKSAAWTSTERAQIYDRTTNSTSDLTHFVTTEYIGLLTQRIAPKSAVLDLGCGTGVLTKALAALGHDVTGVDISHAMLDKIDTGTGLGRITLRQGDVYALPFADASFDGVITRWVIPHFRDWPGIVKEAARVLRPGGTMVIDHTSRANYALAAREGALDHSNFGYDPRVQGGDKTVFYAAASVDELQLAADTAGLDLIDVAPLGFFRQNAVIAAVLGGEGFQAYRKAVDAFYQDPGARAFIQWFEQNITRALPLDMVNGMGVVLRKRAAG
jgi:ubiquinone/menaquinone biosynthesis C-methylase UbiE